MELNPVNNLLENEVGFDRISDLPNTVLEKILSFLPTNNAIAAEILSTKWKNLNPFAFPPIKLVLDDSLLLHHQEEENEPNNNCPCVTFRNFVDKLFNETLSDAHSVESMVLICKHKYGDAKIVSWVRAALRRNVRELSLSLYDLFDAYSLFEGLHGCATLARLKLEFESFAITHPDDFSLPNLKCLHLSNLTLIYEEWLSMKQLIDGCCSLEDLCFTDCNLTVWDSHHINESDIFRIESPQLKKLTMENCFTDNHCDILIDVPYLEALILNDFVASYYYAVKFESLLMADIHIRPSIGQEDNKYCYYDDGSLAELVTACSNTTSLRLTTSSIGALCWTASPLPEFQNLTWLALGRIQHDGWALLASLLQNAPKLEILCFEEEFTETEEGIANFQKSLPVLPLCLFMRMKRIEFFAFKGDENEIKLVEYFLKNGYVLQKVIFFCLPRDDSIVMRLLGLPRQSKNCVIEFSWRDQM